jgi:transcriptional regulator NrdR
MRCPFCGNIDTQVKDSRPAEDHVSIRRRRFCPACGGRFTTYERVQLRDLVVIKTNGKREDFDRDKLERSIRIAMQKRPVEPERIDQMISGIVRRLESMGETDIPSKADRRDRDGAPRPDRHRGLCALCQRLQEFPGRRRFRQFRERAASPEPRRTRHDRQVRPRFMRTRWLGAARAGSVLAQPGGGLRDRQAMAASWGVAGRSRAGAPMPKPWRWRRPVRRRAVPPPMSRWSPARITGRPRPVPMR